MHKILILALLCAWPLHAPAQPDTPPRPSSSQNELVLLNWSEYMDPELIATFEKQFDCTVKQVYFESDDARDDMLVNTSGAGYDVVVVNGASMRAYRQRDWLSPITERGVPNLRHVYSKWRRAFEGADGFGVPYFWGNLGIGYRVDLVEAPLTSWMDLFRPAEDLRGKIVMNDHSRDLIGMALKALGHSSNSADPAELEAAEQLLLAQKPYVKEYGYVALNEESSMVSGEVVAAMLFSGDALMLNEVDPRIEFVVPKEGGNLWADYLVVLRKSRNKALAMAFINFLNEPKNAAQLAEYLYYATPNKAAERYLPQDYFDNSIIYPSQDVLERSEAYTPLPPTATRKRNSIFHNVIN